MPSTKIFGLTALTMAAFAANSVLTRLALSASSIDAASFTAIRIVAGAAVLSPLAYTVIDKSKPACPGSWGSAFALFVYAIAFSFAYLLLDAGTGALILFAAVQATMIGAGLIRGERPGKTEWLGLAVAMGGLLYLVSPGLTAPAPAGVGMMAVAGAAWGVYSIRGLRSDAPLADTAGNFLRAAPLALITAVIVFAVQDIHADRNGILLALASGAVASGLGYVIWYMALGGLAATTGAIVQLSVPILAAVGGVVFIDEQITGRLIIASIMVLGGIAAAILGGSYPTGQKLK